MPSPRQPLPPPRAAPLLRPSPSRPPPPVPGIAHRPTDASPRRARDLPGVLVRDLVRLVVPLSCAGCGEPDVVVCASCLDVLGTGALRADLSAPRLARLPQRPPLRQPSQPERRPRRPAVAGRQGLAPAPGEDPGGGPSSGGVGTLDGLVSRWPVLAGTAYLGDVRSLVGSWKDRGRTDCTPVVAERISEVARSGRAVVEAHLDAGDEVWVVPVPSTPAAVRRRGREPTTELARAVLAVFAEGAADPRPARADPGVRLVRALGHRRRTTLDQAGLGSRDRARNLSGALRVRRRHRRRDVSSDARPRAVCVLVDDVLTTGATLVECERALEEAGLRVVLGLVLTVAPRPGETVTALSQGVVVHSGRRSG